MSAGAYLLVKFNDREKLLPAVQTLGELDQIINWDAVDGHYNLVVKTKDNGLSVVQKIENLDGFAKLSKCQIEKAVESSVEMSPEFMYSYIFIETDKKQRDDIIAKINKYDKVISTTPVTGDFDLVSIVKADNFDIIDKFVNNELRILDGVLRLKQERIIYLDRM